MVDIEQITEINAAFAVAVFLSWRVHGAPHGVSVDT